MKTQSNTAALAALAQNAAPAVPAKGEVAAVDQALVNAVAQAENGPAEAHMGLFLACRSHKVGASQLVAAYKLAGRDMSDATAQVRASEYNAAHKLVLAIKGKGAHAQAAAVIERAAKGGQAGDVRNRIVSAIRAAVKIYQNTAAASHSKIAKTAAEDASKVGAAKAKTANVKRAPRVTTAAANDAEWLATRRAILSQMRTELVARFGDDAKDADSALEDAFEALAQLAGK